MGDRGPAATMVVDKAWDVEFSRWEIGGQPQRYLTVDRGDQSLADGRSGASRNRTRRRMGRTLSLADGRSGASRNRYHRVPIAWPSLADGRSGASRNRSVSGRMRDLV